MAPLTDTDRNALIFEAEASLRTLPVSLLMHVVVEDSDRIPEIERKPVRRGGVASRE